MDNKLVITIVVLALLLGAFLFIPRRPSYIEIEGHVYERLDPIKAVVTIQGAERCFTDLGCGCADYLGRSAPEVNFQSTVNEATAPIGV